VDRSAAYAARWVAKNVVAAGLATKCEVELAYAIGVAKPVSIMVDTFGTGTVADEKIVQAVEKVFDLTPAAIRSRPFTASWLTRQQAFSAVSRSASARRAAKALVCSGCRALQRAVRRWIVGSS
jgi:S-adenosylmethionine synthetase